MSEHQRLLSDAALTAFHLNGQFLALADELARPAGLTATRWQVLGAVLDTPRTVSDIARVMGITRQSVQRTADILVDDGLVAYSDNPAHRRAKLVVATDVGRASVEAITPGHRAAADRLAAMLGAEQWESIIDGMHALSRALDSL